MTRRLGFDPLLAMMAGMQPMVGAGDMTHEIPTAYPGGLLRVPQIGPAAAPVPGMPPLACAPYNPYGPTPPAMGQSFFTSPQTIARGIRAQALKTVPSKGLGFRTVAGTPVAANTAGVQINTGASGLPVCISDLEWHAASAQFFLVSSILCAGREWLVAAGAVPATSFTPDGIRPPMEFPTVWPGVVVTVTVENIDGAAHATSGTFWGIAGDSQPCM